MRVAGAVRRSSNYGECHEVFAGKDDGPGLMLDLRPMSPLLRMALLPKFDLDRSKGVALSSINR